MEVRGTYFNNLLEDCTSRHKSANTRNSVAAWLRKNVHDPCRCAWCVGERRLVLDMAPQIAHSFRANSGTRRGTELARCVWRRRAEQNAYAKA
jgi:hypothetical protein